MTSKTVGEIAGELRALMEKATPGPWSVYSDEGSKIKDAKGDSLLMMMQTHLNGRRDGNEVFATQTLIVAMRNALPALLSALESQTVTAEEVKQASLQCSRVPVEEFWGCVAAALNRAKYGETS